VKRWLALLALLGVAACGLPVSSPPHRIAPSTVPYGLLDLQQATPRATASGPTVSVYLVDGDRLVARPRQITGLNEPAEALRSLLAGPTPAESRRGLVSDIPAQTRLYSLDLQGSIATVDLSPTFGTSGGSQQVLAVAQIVYTITASRYIDAVRFSVDGRPIEVPNGSGSLGSAARTRADYQQDAPASS
jgi:spore germination protein GerM